jgi:hypothetical protein
VCYRPGVELGWRGDRKFGTEQGWGREGDRKCGTEQEWGREKLINEWNGVDCKHSTVIDDTHHLCF